MLRRLKLALLLVLVAIPQGLAAERTWTSTDGRTMRAEFVRALDGEVTFLKDGKIVTLALDKLSQRDQQIVRELAAGQPVPDEQPAAREPSSAPTFEPAPDNPSPVAASPTGESSNPKPLIKKPLPIENRTWTDIHGNQVTGKYVRISGANVVLLRGGRSVTVRYHELGSEDQEYLRELLTSRGQEGIIPPKIDNLGGEQGNNDLAGNDLAGNDLAGNDLAGNDLAGNGDSPAPPGPGAPIPAGVGAPVPGGSRFPRGAGGFPPGIGSPSFPGAGSSPPVPGSSRPGPRGVPPEPSFPPVPSFPGPSFPGTDPGSFGPSASAPGMDNSAMPPGSSFPSANPPGMPGSRFGSGGSSIDRMQEQMERSRQQQLDSMQRMQDRMAEQREQLFNRHGSTGECLNCKHALDDAEMRRTSCPYCGVTWDYEIDEFGNKRNLNNSSLTSPFAGGGNAGGNNLDIDRNTARTIGIVLGALIGLAVVLGMIIGTIYILMSIASASSTSQRQHYR